MQHAKIEIREDGTMELFVGSETPESMSWVFVEPPVSVPVGELEYVLKTLIAEGYEEVVVGTP